MSGLTVVILAAGFGSRLGTTRPKPLTRLTTGASILGRQVDRATRALDPDQIVAVVGYKKGLVMEAFPELTYVYNDAYDTTNTAKSLLQPLEGLPEGDVMWLNGDVVLEEEALTRVAETPGSSMAVRYGQVDDEDVTFREEDGTIAAVGKHVDGVGEAVGVNLVRGDDRPAFEACLADCGDGDYFEAGVQRLVDDGVDVATVDVSDLLCMEVDFPEDLAEADKRLDARK